MIKRLNDIYGKFEDFIQNPLRKAYAIGIPEFDKLYKVVLGRTTWLGGIPSHGKTQFLLEMLIRLSENHGFRHLIYSPETGEAEEIYAELMCMYTKTLLRENAINRLTKERAAHAAAFIHHHFIVRDMTENMPTPKEFIEEVGEFIKTEKIQTITIDPWNEIYHDFNPHGGREDKYLEFSLGLIRRFARKEDIHTFIVVHPRTLRKNSEGIYEAPTAFEFSGGAPWYAKGDSILCAYRPFEFSDTEYERTYVDIIVQKAKPKYIGFKGTFKCDYDLQHGRYRPRHEDKWYDNG